MALTSTFGSIYMDVQVHLTEKATLLRWIDEDNGQLEIEADEYRPAVAFPCGLVEFGAFTYEDSGNGLQLATGTIQIRIAFAPYSNTNSKTPTAYLEKGLQNYEVEKQVTDALHGWAPTGCSRLLRRMAVKEQREIDTLRVRVLTFDLSFTESVGVSAYRQVARPEPVVGTDLELPT